METGAEILILGATTGAVEMADIQVVVADSVVDVAAQGIACSIKTDVPLRRGDKVYKIVESD